MRGCSGFTLIELMVAIAIVAVLSAIAIPQYSGYTARSQLSEAIVMLSGLKTPIAEQFADSNAAASCAIPVGAVTTGTYVANIRAFPSSPCVIVAEMAVAGVHSKISGATVTITYTPATGVWSCVTSAPAEVAPKACPHA